MCRELDGNEPGLVAYYDFNTVAGPAVADGTVVPDITGNGHDGTARLGTGTVSTLTADIECPIADAIPNSSCDASNPNGSIDIASFITPPSVNYTYNIYNGFSTADLRESNSIGQFTGLPGGFYTLTVVDDVTTCITSPVTVSIPDIPDIPNIFTSVTNDSFCVNGDGQIAVTSSSNGAEPASYTYEIFDGFNTTIANRISIETIANGSTGFTFTGLEDGNYRIRVYK